MDALQRENRTADALLLPSLTIPDEVDSLLNLLPKNFLSSRWQQKHADSVHDQRSSLIDIVLDIGPRGQRPWNLTVTAELRGGYLAEGDTITIVFGDTSQGSPGMPESTCSAEYSEAGFAL